MLLDVRGQPDKALLRSSAAHKCEGVHRPLACITLITQQNSSTVSKHIICSPQNHLKPRTLLMHPHTAVYNTKYTTESFLSLDWRQNRWDDNTPTLTRTHTVTIGRRIKIYSFKSAILFHAVHGAVQPRTTAASLTIVKQKPSHIHTQQNKHTHSSSSSHTHHSITPRYLHKLTTSHHTATPPHDYKTITMVASV